MNVTKLPGPDHPITISTAPRQVQARFAGLVIADSADALSLCEATYPPVWYFPRADVEMARLTRTDRSTYCPYKGHASYFSIAIDGARAENAVWSYEAPHPAMEAIAGRLAFYADRVEITEAEPDQD